MAEQFRIVGATAVELAQRVRAGQLDPVAVTRAFLERIEAHDARLGAFQTLLAETALAEAQHLAGRADLAALPLAGVPVAIKDNVAVAGAPLRNGSAASDPAPQPVDHPTVRRLREAGAVVLGTTRVPELCIWGTTDSADLITHNPWDRTRTAGGSSGGSAAAVAGGLVPLALGADGMGSIRIPAAVCGLFGIKPGPQVVPAELGVSSWLGLAENGPLATTVGDAALMLSVLAAEPTLTRPVLPAHPLRIALSARAPLAGGQVDRAMREAVAQTATTLRELGHTVLPIHPPRPSLWVLRGVFAHWFAAVAEDAGQLDAQLLEPRTCRHVSLGRLAQRRGWVRAANRDRWRATMAAFFAGVDVLITPTLAALPPRALAWSRRSWLANILSNVLYAPFTAAWNFAGYPAAALPAGLHPCGLPLSVQLVALPGREALLLALAAQLEQARPWTRYAPGVL